MKWWNKEILISHKIGRRRRRKNHERNENSIRRTFLPFSLGLYLRHIAYERLSFSSVPLILFSLFVRERRRKEIKQKLFFFFLLLPWNRGKKINKTLRYVTRLPCKRKKINFLFGCVHVPCAFLSASSVLFNIQFFFFLFFQFFYFLSSHMLVCVCVCFPSPSFYTFVNCSTKMFCKNQHEQISKSRLMNSELVWRFFFFRCFFFLSFWMFARLFVYRLHPFMKWRENKTNKQP